MLSPDLAGAGLLRLSLQLPATGLGAVMWTHDTAVIKVAEEIILCVLS